jgi:hypothetical protein
VSGKGKREEPSIRIRDESLASLGFRTLVSLGFSKTDAKDVSFKGLFYPLKSMQCQVVLQACASGSSADTIVVAQSSLQHGVINNAKRKW